MVFFIITIVISTSYLNNVVASITTYYLAPHCGQTIDLIDTGAILLKLIAGGVQPDMKCYRLITSSQTGDRIMLYFKDINIARSKGCAMDWLELHDGRTFDSPYVSGLDRNLCGNSINNTVHSTNGSNLYAFFRSGQSVTTKGFDLVITRYHTGTCIKGEYTCQNGRCISESLICNGYNPCGDDSDCRSSTTRSTTIPTTRSTTVPTTRSTTLPTTRSTTVPTTRSSTVPTTQSTTVPTTRSTLPTSRTTPGTTLPDHLGHVHRTTGEIVAIVFGSIAFLSVMVCSIL
ncbi:low-density lipoprotein receptor class A domain-containing protein 2-like [Mercenaria mercenaria]|uniref:low-density lipoprotein receptor class A domain-containing protein 2-like n=1 Tax=Mercenaria mercenaria TaxID=6596 RepID=UPI00234F5FA4|nr:low-density lipoprotein receptor class A domain-containing protein 2-like [Mercenaria mercenaria]